MFYFCRWFGCRMVFEGVFLMGKLIICLRDKKLLYYESFCADETKNKYRRWCKECSVFLELNKKNETEVEA